MKRVYLLQHERAATQNIKTIGVYSSETEAQAARERLAKQPGFRDDRGGFHIDAYDLDTDHWTEGFVDI